MTVIDTPYEDLLKEVLENGSYKEDRTGTGTYSTFGAQLRYDLSESFPLVTTKKVNFHSVLGELLWFLKGSTNNQWLKDRNIKIWNEWADEYGQLGSIYGAQWRNWYHPSEAEISVPIRDVPVKGTSRERSNEVISNYTMGLSMLSKKYPHINPMVLQIWRNNFASYLLSPDWEDVNVFAQELACAPGFSQWYAHPDNYRIFPQYYGTRRLGKETAIFIPESYAKEIEDSPLATLHDDKNGNPAVLRKSIVVDQVANIVDTIANNPDSRRIILNAWNVGELANMALPPCHAFFQFYVKDGKLSGMLTQRSADLFLGVPFNLASYALLIHMTARLTGLEVGELVWTGGDCHIYANHVEQVKTQISRTPKQYPQIKFNNDPKTPLWDYDFEDVEVVGYDPHPFIKGAVAV